MISAISEFDTTTLYNQIQADLVGFKEEEQAQFVEWFDYMKDQLSEDAAGNLQLQINEANEKVGLLQNLTTVVKTSIVDAINWIKEQIDTINNNLANQSKQLSELNSDLSKKGLTLLYEMYNGLTSEKTVEIPDVSQYDMILMNIGWYGAWAYSNMSQIDNANGFQIFQYFGIDNVLKRRGYMVKFPTNTSATITPIVDTGYDTNGVSLQIIGVKF